MKTFRILLWILVVFFWFFSLYILIEALTVPSSNNPFWPYRFIISVMFIAVTGFLRIFYKRMKKHGWMNTD